MPPPHKVIVLNLEVTFVEQIVMVKLLQAEVMVYGLVRELSDRRGCLDCYARI